MTNLYELLIFIGSGLTLLILMSVFIGSFICIEVPLLGKVPLGLVLTVAFSLYGCFGLILLGLVQNFFPEFSLTSEIRMVLGSFATITSYFFGKIIMQMFQETPYQPFCDRAIGLKAKIRYRPTQSDRLGDALIFDPQEKITQIVTIYLADWAKEIELKTNDDVRIIDYLPHQKAFLVIKSGGLDELTWQNLSFSE